MKIKALLKPHVLKRLLILFAKLVPMVYVIAELLIKSFLVFLEIFV